MARKRRRKFCHHGEAFEWWIAEDSDKVDMELNIHSSFGLLKVRYVLGQPDDENRCIHYTQIHPDEARRITGGCFKCPHFDPHGVVHPGDIGAIIEWCRSNTEPKLPPQIRWFASGSRPDIDGYNASRRSQMNQKLEPPQVSPEL